MKKTLHITRCYILLLFLVIIFLNQFAFADTEVGGNITADTTWTKANSPYIVISTVQVLEGVKLTIEPGATIKFNQDTELNVGGELNAVGAEENMITFTSNQSEPSPEDWGKIRLDSTAIGSVFDTQYNYLSGSIIKYCNIEYGDCIYSYVPILITDNIISNMTTGIKLKQSDGSLLSHNTIANNSEGIALEQSDLNIIVNNTINNNNAAIRLADSHNNTLEHNAIVENIFLADFCSGIKLENSNNNDIKNNTIKVNESYHCSDIKVGG